MKNPIHIVLLICLVPAGFLWADESTEVRAAIDNYLEAEWGAGNVEWVELSMPNSKLLNAGDGWTLDGPEKPHGRVPLYAIVLKDNAVLRKIPFRIRVMPFAWTPVLARPVQRGTIIESDLIRWERREVTDIRHPWPESPDILGAKELRARRNMQAGDVLTWPDVERQPEVCQGDRVVLHLQRGSICVETEGIAMQDGYLGEMIRVEQEELQSLLKVRVTGVERAEIISALGR